MTGATAIIVLLATRAEGGQSDRALAAGRLWAGSTVALFTTSGMPSAAYCKPNPEHGAVAQVKRAYALAPWWSCHRGRNRYDWRTAERTFACRVLLAGVPQESPMADANATRPHLRATWPTQ